jgi:putative hydrolase of the HAD superfamily
MSADLRHIDTWLFDLDNTLYPAESMHMRLVEERMTDFVEKLSGLPRDEARVLQKQYYHGHGTTLAGLMANHDVDPDEFLEFVHDVSMERLTPDPALKAALARLPGRRLIFTNGSASHAERVLEALRLADLFEATFHIEAAGYRPKPAPETFAQMIGDHKIHARGAAFFEDSEENLAPAHDLHMTTILVGAHAAASTAPFVNHRTDDLAAFLATARVQDAAA